MSRKTSYSSNLKDTVSAAAQAQRYLKGCVDRFSCLYIPYLEVLCNNFLTSFISEEISKSAVQKRKQYKKIESAGNELFTYLNLLQDFHKLLLSGEKSQLSESDVQCSLFPSVSPKMFVSMHNVYGIASIFEWASIRWKKETEVS